MVFLSISSTFLGLLLSSIVKNTERAMTILPLILLPQIMLAGIIARVNNGFVELISYLTISRWGVEGFSIIQKDVITEYNNPLGLLKKDKVDAKESIINRFHESYYNKDIFENLTGTLQLDVCAITLMTLTMIILTYYALKNKDSV